MRTIGIDVGTTTISAVVVEEDGRILDRLTVPNHAQRPGQGPWERLQDPEQVWKISLDLLGRLTAKWPDAAGIGVTGQQHGILYLDAAGEPVSPLYTWQDQRAGLPRGDGESYAAYLSRVTGFSVAPGYGLATHFYQVEHHLVPQQAKTFCTIPDFLAMRLSGRKTPRLDASNGASLGLFRLEAGAFSLDAMGEAGMSAALLPEVGGPGLLGIGPMGYPVSVAIGDNQASFLGATGGGKKGVLVNMGTGGQISIYTPHSTIVEGLETRPYPLGGCLLVGASLCGGRSYALLERFFRMTVEMVTGQAPSCYEAMERLLAASVPPKNVPRVQTTFAGTRQDPAQRGAITGIDPDNFTPLHWIYGMMQGMAEELYELYRRGCPDRAPEALYGAGNGLRKNRFLRAIVEERFGCPMVLSPNEEEAACGAALYVQAQLKGMIREREDGNGKTI